MASNRTATRTAAKSPAKAGTVRKSITEYEDMAIAAEDTDVLFVWPIKRELGVIAVSRFKGSAALDLRRYYVNDNDQWSPSSKGIKISPNDVDTVIDALVKFRDTIKAKLAK